MQYIKYLTIIMLLNFVSCDSYLDQVNPNALSKESIGQSESDLTLLLMGCYSALQRNYSDAYRFLDCFSEVGYGEVVITEGGSTPQTQTYLAYWTREYSLIARCNELLASMKDIALPTDKMLIIESEAKFLRALAYFNLTALYKDVPLIKDHQKFDDRFVSKNSQAEIKAFILSDLDEVILNLPINQIYPKATKGAALALKAKIHAFFSEWDEVLSLTQDVLDLNKYDLYPDYITLFTPLAEGSIESIFAVAFETGVGQGERFAGSWPLQPAATNLRPLPIYADAFYCIDGLPISESPLYDPQTFYENRDPRYEVSILRAGEDWIGRPYDPGTSVTTYSTQKYVRNTTAIRSDGDQDYMYLRFADILLMRAEALVEKNSLNQEVYQLVDKVRSRVGMPSIEEVEGNNLSQSEMRELIRHERLVEFGEEGGIRWFDIKRWNIVEKVYNSITFHKRPFLGEKTIYWPIPQIEIDNNKNLVQHEFWN